MSKAKYYLLHDCDMQWFSAIVELEGEPKDNRYDHFQITKLTELPNEARGDFVNNLSSREPHFWRREINRMGYAGWGLSKQEYDRVLEIIELFPQHQKYLKLLHK